MLDVQATVTVIVGLIATVGAIIAAIIAANSAHQARRANRVDELEELLAKYQKDIHRNYLYNRELVDHIYRDLGPPPPPPPPGLFT